MQGDERAPRGVKRDPVLHENSDNPQIPASAERLEKIRVPRQLPVRDSQRPEQGEGHEKSEDEGDGDEHSVPQEHPADVESESQGEEKEEQSRKHDRTQVQRTFRGRPTYANEAVERPHELPGEHSAPHGVRPANRSYLELKSLRYVREAINIQMVD